MLAKHFPIQGWRTSCATWGWKFFGCFTGGRTEREEDWVRGDLSMSANWPWARCTKPVPCWVWRTARQPQEALTETSLHDFQSLRAGPVQVQAQERTQGGRWSESSFLTTKNHSSIVNGKDQGMVASGTQFDLLCPYGILCFFKIMSQIIKTKLYIFLNLY